MNKFASLFNENMSDIESSVILFKMSKKVNQDEKGELFEAWKENNSKISARIDREFGEYALTNSSI